MHSTVTLFCRVNSQLQNTGFQHRHHRYRCSVASNEQKPACCACINLHQWRRDTVTAATAKMHQTLLHCAHIHCLVSSNVQQTLMNVRVNGCHFLHVEEINDTPLLHPHFHVRRHCIRLPLCCHLSHGNKM